jgi:hypothetical protein
MCERREVTEDKDCFIMKKVMIYLSCNVTLRDIKWHDDTYGIALSSFET